MPEPHGIGMDYASSHVVYVDSRMSRGLDGRHISKSASGRSRESRKGRDASWERKHPECLEAILGEIEEVRLSLKNLLAVFDGVHTCASGISCMDEIHKTEKAPDDHRPVLVVVGTSSEDVLENPLDTVEGDSPISSKGNHFSGTTLIRHLNAQISSSNLSKRIVPLAMLYDHDYDAVPHNTLAKSGSRPSSGAFTQKSRKSSTTNDKSTSAKQLLAEPQTLTKYIDIGAVEVLPSPLPTDRLTSLVSHAHRAHKESLTERGEQVRRRKARKLSWLGNNDERPYAYLREKMVSELMTGICYPDQFLHQVEIQILPDLDPVRERDLKSALGSWSYSGHDFSDDELIHGACFMLQHALSLPQLEKWRLPRSELKTFLIASRAAYNGFVNYHNFRHVIDVMQAVFYFLIQIGTLPIYPAVEANPDPDKTLSPIADLLKPFDALTLLITAIGHDVGHPGVNNAFLVSLNAPLAQLYNDRSVLEAFHCAAYSQILRRHWKASFEDIPMRGLMINSILATDMGVHMKYMSDLGNLQERLHHNKGTDGWSAQVLDECRVLTCALLIKCADISNVTRPFDIALKWADRLQLEFANQGVMETELGIPTTLFGGPPELGNLIKLGKSQIGFMNIFARPLFEAVSDILPAMMFTVEEMKANQMIWTNKIKEEEEREDFSDRKPSEGLLSPRSLSPNQHSSRPESSHPEGLPASNSSPTVTSVSPVMLGLEADNLQDRSLSSLHQDPNLSDQNLRQSDTSRRSSGGLPRRHLGSDPDSTASFSRRSSGALSTSNIPHSIVSARRTSNSSPSQLQLGLDSRSQTDSSATASENRQPNGHASDDTLSQSQYPPTGRITNDQRREPLGTNEESKRLSSKGSGSENMRSIQSSTSQPSNRNGHHRSSSGAHTTNTTVSQSTPYSPTGTQATSFLTAESDAGRSQERLNSSGSRENQGTLNVVNVGQHFGHVNGFDGTHEKETKSTSLNDRNLIKDTSSVGYRSIGRKSSRFNFNFFKKRGKSVEAGP